MAKISRRRLAKAAVRMISDQPTQRNKIVRSLAAYLIANKQAKQLDLLIKDIASELQISEGILTAEVQTAFELDNSTRAQLVDYLKKSTGTKHIELQQAVQPNLISGVIIRTADSELDTSARRKLKQLASLNSGGIK